MKERMAQFNHIYHAYQSVKNNLSEKERRLWAAQQAQDYGHGGIALVSQATGMAIPTIRRGIKELTNPPPLSPLVRHPGGGRKKISTLNPLLLLAIDELMKPHYLPDQQSCFVWTLHDLFALTKRLKLSHFSLGHMTLARLLHEHGYYLRPPHKPGRAFPSKERDGQCKRIGVMAERCLQEQQPLLFLDIYQWQGEDPCSLTPPVENTLMPCDHGDLTRDKGWISVGIHDHHHAWAIRSLQSWWHTIGQHSYLSAEKLYLVVRGYFKGTPGSQERNPQSERSQENESRWMQGLQHLSHDIGLPIRVRHLPPCTFRWNNILHKTTTYSEVDGTIMAINLSTIGIAQNAAILSAFWDTRPPSTMPPVKINLKKDIFHPEWNYEVQPPFKKRKRSPKARQG